MKFSINSKIESGHLKIRTEALQVCEIIDDPARLLAMQASKTQVDFITRVDPALPKTLVGDFQRLRQIVINLGSNALKFTKTGSVVLDLKLVGENGDKCILQVDVQDTGCGIPKENLADVFEHFTQVDSSFTRPHEGTGLGLAISKGLVELMGGQIWATSEEGKGSVFSFQVPLTSAGQSKRLRPGCDTSGKTVLIVDKSEQRRKILGELFSSWDMKVNQSDTLSNVFRQSSDTGQEDDFALIYCNDRCFEEAEAIDIAAILKATNNGAALLLMSPFGAPALTIVDLPADRVTRVTLPMGLGQIIQDVETAVASPDNKTAASATSNVSQDVLASDQIRLQKSSVDTVLIVDDNKTNLKLVQMIVRKLGVRQVSAQNGLEAVSAYEKHRPKLVLMDVSMPVMNGLDATREIRDLERQLDSPASTIIGLTAHTMESDRKACFDHGMNDHMAKPVSVSALRQLVQKNISLHETNTPGP